LGDGGRGLGVLAWEGPDGGRVEVDAAWLDDAACDIDRGGRREGPHGAAFAAVGEDCDGIDELGWVGAGDADCVAAGRLVELDEDGVALAVEDVDGVDFDGLDVLAVRGVHPEGVLVDADA